ncbi:MAG TPA: hypothetical protein VMZ53_32795 [Kofleriaceae bacterium]|nr:hypothetical protein [Kofleriaceae bacterium]
MTTNFETIDLAQLSTVSGGEGEGGSGGGGFVQGVKDAWQGVKDFSGGFAGGAIHGQNMRTSQMPFYSQNPSGQATKAGFETGAMFNQALGPAGRVLSLMGKSAPSGG